MAELDSVNPNSGLIPFILFILSKIRTQFSCGIFF